MKHILYLKEGKPKSGQIIQELMALGPEERDKNFEIVYVHPDQQQFKANNNIVVNGCPTLHYANGKNQIEVKEREDCIETVKKLVRVIINRRAKAGEAAPSGASHDDFAPHSRARGQNVDVEGAKGVVFDPDFITNTPRLNPDAGAAGSKLSPEDVSKMWRERDEQDARALQRRNGGRLG